MRVRSDLLVACLAVVVASSACSSSGDPPGAALGHDDPVTAALAAALAGQAQLSRQAVSLDAHLAEPASARLPGDGAPTLASCQAVEDALVTLCGTFPAFAPSGCDAKTTFFYAHQQPRCAARVQLLPASYPENAPPDDIYAFDLTGPPVLGALPSCGNGDLEPREQETCDDGNREGWDGCDPDCQTEPFNGCETVIEEEFRTRDVAFVDRLVWSSPRSHMMVHATAAPLRAMDASLCGDALVAAQASCDRITTDMPFAGWCQPQVEARADACHVRLRVGFVSLDPPHGVFTTGLDGLLSFTIR